MVKDRRLLPGRVALRGEGDHLLGEVKRQPVMVEDRGGAADPARAAVVEKTVQRGAVAAQDRGRDAGLGMGIQPLDQFLHEP